MVFPNCKENVQTDRIKSFDNELFFFSEGNGIPFADRSSDIITPTVPAAFGKLLFDVGAFSLYESQGELYCLYHGTRRIVARISPLNNTPIGEITVRKLEDYLWSAYRLDPYAITARMAFERFEILVSSVAEFCGCLTDILQDGGDPLSIPPYALSVQNVNCEHIALSLPIISLMFRRISSLRGFNFKVTVNGDLPCLIFSAGILPDNFGVTPDLSQIPEYSQLLDTVGDDGLIIGARIREVDETEDHGDRVYRLSLAICPQTVDPRGILRAPVWREQTKDILDSLDIDLEGKY